MKASNPHFQNIGRAPYELPYLVKSLGDVDRSAILDADQAHKVEAITSHAFNATEIVAGGLASIGHLMSMVGNTEDEVDGCHVANLGDLIKHLAAEIEYLHEVETDMRTLLMRQPVVTPAPPQRHRPAPKTTGRQSE